MVLNSKAVHGHSKEKRTDCPLVTLGLVLDGSGSVWQLRMFAGNVSEASTLETMVSDLKAPRGAMVIMDRRSVSEENITWLVENGYWYIVVSRGRKRPFDGDREVTIQGSSHQEIRIHRVVDEEGKEARLYCYSEKRAEKEKAIYHRLCDRFEKGLEKIRQDLSKPRGRILQEM